MPLCYGLKRFSFLLGICTFLCLPTSRAQALELVFSVAEYPPFYAPDLPNQGLLPDIVNRSLSRKGHRVTFSFATWARALRRARMGDTDGMIGLWYTDTRAEHYHFSVPMVANQMVFYKRRGEELYYDDYSDLVQQGLHLGGVIGYIYPSGLEESGITKTLVSDESQIFRLLSERRVDIVAVDRDFANYTLSKPPYDQYRDSIEAAPRVLETRFQYIVSAKKLPHAEQIIKDFNAGFTELLQSGEIDELIKLHLKR